jgi:3-hydroxyisobutyrate dehydrogenase-like beta-hydroxyacid dehydrogenase
MGTSMTRNLMKSSYELVVYAMGSSVTLVGENGVGQITKLANIKERK